MVTPEPPLVHKPWVTFVGLEVIYLEWAAFWLQALLVVVMLVLAAKMAIAPLPLKLRVQVQAELGRVLELRVVVLQAIALTFAIQFALEIRAARVAVLVLKRVSTVLV
jgi:hypothetical protein